MCCHCDRYRDVLGDCSRADACPPCVNEDTPRKEGAGESGGHVHEWGEWKRPLVAPGRIEYAFCTCGASLARRAEPQEPVCVFCEGPHVTEECQGLEPPGDAAAVTFPKVTPPAPRPPYAVAYSVAGTLREVFLPGDASATAEDGVLTIRHDGPVLAIVRVNPIKEGQA